MRHDIKMIRAEKRKWESKNDPYFAKRRPGGEMGRTKSKAGRNKKAARGRSCKSWD